MSTSHDQQSLKRTAALHAVTYVQDGMNVGLGTGSTSEFAVREIGRRVREEGLRITGVPTSERTARLALELGIPIMTLDERPRLDVTIDGADEVELANLSVIKGLGGALLREKMVALATDTPILIVDESKVVGQLGEHGTPVPVEVVTFGWARTCAALHALGCETERRPSGPYGQLYITDGGNYLIDCRFPPISDPGALAGQIKALTGVVEHGLFVNIARRVVIASEGEVRVVER